jgi:hypothetical protein
MLQVKVWSEFSFSKGKEKTPMIPPEFLNIIYLTPQSEEHHLLLGALPNSG